MNRPGLVQYDKEKSLKNYIENAGGYTKYADKKNITIIFANGDVRTKKKVFQTEIREGPTIIVNFKEKHEPFNLTEFTTNFASIITSMATLYLIIIN